jgi:hypothetical protein
VGAFLFCFGGTIAPDFWNPEESICNLGILLSLSTTCL